MSTVAKELIGECIEIGVPADTNLFDIPYCSGEFIEHLEGYDKEWVSAIKSDRNVVYAGERMLIDALAKRIDTQSRIVDGEIYHIWTKKLQVSRLGKVKVLITEKESSDEDDEKSVKYIVRDEKYE